jgi:hypothetical protein
MKLDTKYEEQDYVEAIVVVSLCHDEKTREIEHEKMLDETHEQEG